MLEPENNAVELHREQLPALSPHDLNPGVLIKAIIDKGVTTENVTAVEKLIELYEKMEGRKAERAFATAFAELQAEIPKNFVMKPIPDKSGGIKYTYAPYEAIMEAIQPFLIKHGFSVTMDTDSTVPNKITKICILTHRDGHSRQTRFTCRIGSGPPGANEAQADGAASTYAKRFAFCDALNIVVDKDSDNNPSAEGTVISEALAKSIESRVKAAGIDEVKFLRFCGAKSYREIMSGRYASIDENLRRKEGEKKPA